MKRTLPYSFLFLALILLVESGVSSAENPTGFTAEVPILVSVHLTVLPQVQVTAPEPWTAESGTEAGQFLIERVDSAPSTVTVHFTIEGTATYGTDYMLSSDPPMELSVETDGTITGTVALGEGESASIAVTPIDDSEVEGAESVVLTLVPDASYAIARSEGATVVILEDEWIYNSETGSEYRLSSPGTWPEAEAEAVSLGGHLVAVDNSLEDQWLLGIFGSLGIGPDALWIGLTDAAAESVWTWSNGQPVTYTNWQAGAPDTSGNQDYAAMYTTGAALQGNTPGKWNDYGLDAVYPGIVERSVEPPQIVTDPVPQKVNLGDQAEFTVEATGTEPLSYQWRIDGAEIPGATSAILEIPSAQESDGGNYDCVVSNVGGSAVSNPAVLEVNRAPSAGPDNYTVLQGGTLDVPAPGVLANDSDLDGDALAAQLATAPAHAGQFVLHPTGAFTYVHNGSNTTQDSFAYKANDGLLDSVPTTVSITVTPVTGALRVTIQPAAACSAGAQWRVDGGAWQDSGATVAGLSAGDHVVSFKDLAGVCWTKPDDRSVAIIANQTTQLAGTYTRLAPPAPANVRATDGTFTDKVVVTWDASPTATQYEVYRAQNQDFSAAQLLGSTAATSFNDTTAKAPTTSAGGGCGGGSTTTYYYYWYWVKAVSDAGASQPGGPDRGHRGGSAKKLSESIYEPVLPRIVFDDSAPEAQARLATPNSPLAVRLRSEEAIDLSSVWGMVACSTFETDAVDWQPSEPGDPCDGWVVYVPVAPWAAGEEIMMIVGAQTVSGVALGPFAYTFHVVPTEDEEPIAASVAQPRGHQPYTTIEEVQVWVGEAYEVEGMTLPGAGIGPVYEIGPDQLYAEPQEVRLPLPRGVAAGDIQVSYYHVEDGEGVWCPAENIDGYLAPDPETGCYYLEERLDGARYLVLHVQHGATVQLGLRSAQSTSPATVLPMSGSLGNLTLLAFAGAILVVCTRLSGRSGDGLRFQTMTRSVVQSRRRTQSRT